jgi:hypothetical protein
LILGSRADSIYPGASRFRSREGLFLFGKVRRSDWIPVGKTKANWELRRSAASMSSESAHDSGHDSESDDPNMGFDTSSSRSDSEEYHSDSDYEAAFGEDNYWDDVEGDDSDHEYVCRLSSNSLSFTIK